MARPKELQLPSRLNLLVDKKIKDRAFKIASSQNMSVGKLVSKLVSDYKIKG